MQAVWTCLALAPNLANIPVPFRQIHHLHEDQHVGLLLVFWKKKINSGFMVYKCH